VGLVGPNEVPETYLLRGATSLGGNRYKATKDRSESQTFSLRRARVHREVMWPRMFKLGVYLLREADRVVHTTCFNGRRKLLAAG
jgi:hypothetical protein